MSEPIDPRQRNFLTVGLLLSLIRANILPDVVGTSPRFYTRTQLVGITVLSAYVAYGWQSLPVGFAMWVLYLPFLLIGLFFETGKSRYRHLVAFLVILVLGALLFGFPDHTLGSLGHEYQLSRDDKSGLSIVLFCSPLFIIPSYLLSFWLCGFCLRRIAEGKQRDRADSRRHDP